MKKLHYISFNIPNQVGSRLRSALSRLGCEQWWQPPPTERGLPSFENTFDSQDPRLCQVRNLAASEGIRVFERVEHVYTPAELRAVPLLEFSVELAPRDLGDAYVEQYDLSTGCPHCRTGARQVRSVRVTPEFDDGESGFPRKGMICQSVDFDYFVRGDLHVTLAAADLSGLEFMEALSATNTPLGWWQLIARHVLPRMSPETCGIIRERNKDGQGCHHCDRDNYFHTTAEPSQITYHRSELGSRPLPDIAYTWECFGQSCFDRNRYIARPRVLVSPKVFDIFRKQKIRAARFVPVQIIDD